MLFSIVYVSANKTNAFVERNGTVQSTEHMRRDCESHSSVFSRGTLKLTLCQNVVRLGDDIRWVM